MVKPVKVDYDRFTRHEFTIHKEAVLQRLDIYVHKRLPTYSRTLVQKLIKGGKITIAGRPTRPGVRSGTAVASAAPSGAVRSGAEAPSWRGCASWTMPRPATAPAA